MFPLRSSSNEFVNFLAVLAPGYPQTRTRSAKIPILEIGGGISIYNLYRLLPMDIGAAGEQK